MPHPLQTANTECQQQGSRQQEYIWLEKGVGSMPQGGLTRVCTGPPGASLWPASQASPGSDTHCSVSIRTILPPHFFNKLVQSCKLCQEVKGLWAVARAVTPYQKAYTPIAAGLGTGHPGFVMTLWASPLARATCSLYLTAYTYALRPLANHSTARPTFLNVSESGCPAVAKAHSKSDMY